MRAIAIIHGEDKALMANVTLDSVAELCGVIPKSMSWCDEPVETVESAGTLT